MQQQCSKQQNFSNSQKILSTALPGLTMHCQYNGVNSVQPHTTERFKMPRDQSDWQIKGLGAGLGSRHIARMRHMGTRDCNREPTQTPFRNICTKQQLIGMLQAVSK